MWRVVIVFQPFDFGLSLRQFRGLSFVGDEHARFAATDDWLFDVCEERAQRIEIARLDWIKLVIVTLGTTNRLPQPDGAYRANAIGEHPGFIIFRLRAALLGGEEQTVESGTHFLLEAADGQQVAGELFAGENIKGFVLVERLDHIIAVRPDVPRIVRVIPNRVGKPHHVEPAQSHPLAVMR